MINIEPQPEHKWLQRLVGEWTMEGEATMGPDQPLGAVPQVEATNRAANAHFHSHEGN